MMMRKIGLIGMLLMVLAVAFVVGCASYPYPLQEFKDADMAIKEAEKVGAPQVSPADVEEAKAEVKVAYDIYRACRNDEAIKHLMKAIELANKRMMGQGPVAVISGPENVAVGEVAAYSGEKSYDPDNQPLTYIWDFGDRGTAQGATASHSWENTGVFAVKLIVTDPDGKADTAEMMVNVGPKAAEKKYITLSNTVLFDFDKSIVKPKAEAILSDIAKTLKDDPELKALLEGHTCNIGTDAYNMGLSKKRAYAVEKYLAKKGVDASAMTVKWYGESKPIADNKTKAGRMQNRRTEIHLSK